MYDHIGLRTPDLASSSAFYRATLEPLGYQLVSQDEAGAGFGTAEETFLWLHNAAASSSSGVHLALRVASQDAVNRFYAAALAAGARDNGPPGLRPAYGPNYYAAFVLDPDGNNLEALCLT